MSDSSSKTRQGANRLVLFVIAGLSLTISIVASQLGASQKWDVGLGTTFLVFAVVIKQFPKDWRRLQFWETILIFLALHCVGLYLVLHVLLRNQVRVPTLFSGTFAFVEGIVLWLAVLWVKENIWKTTKTP